MINNYLKIVIGEKSGLGPVGFIPDGTQRWGRYLEADGIPSANRGKKTGPTGNESLAFCSYRRSRIPVRFEVLEQLFDHLGTFFRQVALLQGIIQVVV